MIIICSILPFRNDRLLVNIPQPRSDVSPVDLNGLVNHVILKYGGELCTEPEDDGNCMIKIDFPEQVSRVRAGLYKIYFPLGMNKSPQNN